MGLIAMSERDLQRIEVLSKVLTGRTCSIRPSMRRLGIAEKAPIELAAAGTARGVARSTARSILRRRFLRSRSTRDSGHSTRWRI
ncbi:hypothetical protein ELI07_26375 (plasmid) [Rhizobium leguminosarum]|nr:hypothetical protein ELI40_33225 [Rhizobium leguminosarum]TAX05780.1 hypothetical protein ELI07_26375 [Rhizobium leguminosarum]TAY07400.1 hypothetical protein ELH96_27620 [Rhizobium leguminosarum]TAZ05733.1 hypothetical protein ELH81_26110 [Rhizobium leguminosarum]